ncbi:MAG: hypothetical protein AAFQ94_10210 [Bacteroidota bacterium]
MKKGNKILDYFKEVTIVVIGVLIAVSIGNYKENLDNKEYLRKTLEAIENEILTSQVEIDTVLSRHMALLEKLESSDIQMTLGEFISSSGGFQVALIKNISLRFFISNKAELLEYEIIAQLFEIEQSTKILSDKIDRLAGLAYDHINDNDEEVMMKFYYLLSDVIDSEQSLLESYSEFLEQNKKELESKNE